MLPLMDQALILIQKKDRWQKKDAKSKSLQDYTKPDTAEK